MDSVVIVKCEPCFGGKAHSVEFADGRKATAWNNKIDSGILMQAYASRKPIGVELKPYDSNGKQGLNVIKIDMTETTMNSENPAITPDPYANGNTPAPENLYDMKTKNIMAQTMMKCFFYGNKADSTDQVLRVFKDFEKKLE